MLKTSIISGSALLGLMLSIQMDSQKEITLQTIECTNGNDARTIDYIQSGNGQLAKYHARISGKDGNVIINTTQTRSIDHLNGTARREADYLRSQGWGCRAIS